MRSSPHKISLPAAVLFFGALSLHALPTTELQRDSALPSAIVSAANMSDRRSVLESLRQDVTQHPADYVTFETETAARRFIQDHLTASRETDRIMVSRGILGYWQGRIVAVVPSLATRNLLASPK